MDTSSPHTQNKDRQRSRLAVIGAGITGLALARELQSDFAVTLFDAEAQPGGNIRPFLFTDLQGRPRELDTGFLAYQPTHYPQFSRLLDVLGITSTEMPLSSSLAIRDSTGKLLANPGNFLRQRNDGDKSASAQDRRRLIGLFLALEENPAILDNVPLNIEQFLAQRDFSPSVLNRFIVPIMATIWGFQEHQVRAMAAGCVLGELCRLLSPARCFVPSTKSYLQALVNSLQDNVQILPAHPVSDITQSARGISLHCKDRLWQFDYAVITTHPAMTLSLTNNLPPLIKKCLANMLYYRSAAVVHSAGPGLMQDEQNETLFTLRYLHGTEGEWITTWDLNSDADKKDPDRPVVSFGHDSLYKSRLLKDSHIYKTFVNHHPSLTPAFWQAQELLKELNTGPRLFLAGSFFGRLGNHENAYCSALDVARRLREQANLTR